MDALSVERFEGPYCGPLIKGWAYAPSIVTLANGKTLGRTPLSQATLSYGEAGLRAIRSIRTRGNRLTSRRFREDGRDKGFQGSSCDHRAEAAA